MSNDQDRVTMLASILGLSTRDLQRHLIRPLAPPAMGLPPGLAIPEICKNVFAITDGFWLFGNESCNGFKFWSSQDYSECGDEILRSSAENGIFPFFGDIPHLTSLSLSNGSVVSSDWEVYHRPEHGWGEVIAKDLHTFLHTLIEVREKYGYDENSPEDWWHPYAAHGSRYDLESQ